MEFLGSKIASPAAFRVVAPLRVDGSRATLADRETLFGTTFDAQGLLREILHAHRSFGGRLLRKTLSHSLNRGKL